MFLRPAFHQERKHEPIEHFLNDQNRKNFKTIKYWNPQEYNEKWLLWHPKWQNSVVFQNIDWTYYTHVNREVVWHVSSSCFCRTRFSVENFVKQKYLKTIFPIFKIFTKLKTDIAVWWPHSICIFGEAQSVLALKLFSWRRFPRTIILAKIGKQTPFWYYLRPSYRTSENSFGLDMRN